MLIKTKPFVFEGKMDTGNETIQSANLPNSHHFYFSAVCWNADALTDVQLGGTDADANGEAEVNV